MCRDNLSYSLANEKETEKSNEEIFLDMITDQAPADPEIIFMVLPSDSPPVLALYMLRCLLGPLDPGSGMEKKS